MRKIVLIILIFIVSCATSDEKTVQENTEVKKDAAYYKNNQRLIEKKKEKTRLYHDVWEGMKEEMISDECREVKSKELMKKLNGFRKCNKDSDCVSLFNGAGTVNKEHFQDHIKENNEFDKECLPKDFFIHEKHPPASDYVFYCSDDGYCNSVMKRCIKEDWEESKCK